MIAATFGACGQVAPRKLRPRSVMAVAILACVVALGFQGSRGIWEPDEGFYCNAALTMAAGGDLLIPRVDDKVFLDKPPLNYWAIAAGIRLLGVNEWGVRVPHAVWFLGAVLMAGLLARQLSPGATGVGAALVYATMLLPVAASNTITPDTPLTFFCALAYYAYWRAGKKPEPRVGPVGWWIASGGAVGLGFLTKGPAMLVCCVPMAVHMALVPRIRRQCLTPGPWIAGAVAAAIGASWYGHVMGHVPGAGAYLWDNQVAGRLVTARYKRNPGLTGSLIYLPTILFGTQPWSSAWCWRRFRDRPATVPRDAEGGFLLLVLWMVVPLGIFLLASSRLPLYILPMALPFAILVARSLGECPDRKARQAAGILAWCALLLGLKAVVAHWPTTQDSRAFAHSLPAAARLGDVELVLFTRRPGLKLYGIRRTEFVTIDGTEYPFFASSPTARSEVHELPFASYVHAFVVRPKWADYVKCLVAQECPSCRCDELPGPFDQRIVRCGPLAPVKPAVASVRDAHSSGDP